MKTQWCAPAAPALASCPQYTKTLTHRYTKTLTHRYTHTDTHRYAHTDTRSHTDTHKDAHTQIHTKTFTHRYTHTQTNLIYFVPKRHLFPPDCSPHSLPCHISHITHTHRHPTTSSRRTVWRAPSDQNPTQMQIDQPHLKTRKLCSCYYLNHRSPPTYIGTTTKRVTHW